jgi:hypothetical protein
MIRPGRSSIVYVEVQVRGSDYRIGCVRNEGVELPHKAGDTPAHQGAHVLRGYPTLHCVRSRLFDFAVSVSAVRFTLTPG